MVSMTRPHIMFWTTKAGEATDSPEGYPIPGEPGEEMQIPCRFHDSMGRGKVFKNEDSTETMQVGTIRIDPNVELPEKGSMIRVVDEDDREVYSGTVKETPYRGSLSSRVEV